MPGFEVKYFSHWHIPVLKSVPSFKKNILKEEKNMQILEIFFFPS